jgi:hypothetical protein
MHIMLGSCVPNLRHRGWVEHTKKFHYTNNSWGIFSEFAISLNKNPNGWFEGPTLL